MGIKNRGPWCPERYCTIHRISWTGKGLCPRCQLNQVLTDQAQKELARELSGVKLNHIIISGTLDGKPTMAKQEDKTLVKFRLQNTRLDNAQEKKTWLDVSFLVESSEYIKQCLEPGASVVVKGAIVSMKKGSKFTLSIKAHEVELI